MPVTIEFDKTRTLKFDMAAVRDLEAALDGRPLGSVVGDIQRLSVTAITAALWAGLKHEDKSLNVNLVGKMLDRYLQNKGRVHVLGKAISDGLVETGIFNDGDDDEGNEQPEQAPA